jgi:hypothetical protein
VAVKGFDEVLQELAGSVFTNNVVNEMRNVGYVDFKIPHILPLILRLNNKLVLQNKNLQ